MDKRTILRQLLSNDPDQVGRAKSFLKYGKEFLIVMNLTGEESDTLQLAGGGTISRKEWNALPGIKTNVTVAID